MNIFKNQKVIFVFLLAATAIVTFWVYYFVNQKFVLFRQGEQKLQKHQYEEAIVYYQKAMAEGFNRPRVYLHLAEAYTATKQFDEASQQYSHYLEFYPEDRFARLMLARVLSYAGHYDESVEQYRKAEELEKAHQENKP